MDRKRVWVKWLSRRITMQAGAYDPCRSLCTIWTEQSPVYRQIAVEQTSTGLPCSHMVVHGFAGSFLISLQRQRADSGADSDAGEASAVAFVAPIAVPLAGKKLLKKTLKVVKKGAYDTEAQAWDDIV